MQAAQRERMMIGLSMVAGSLDSWSYFSLGHLFIANMTGNTIMLGYAAASRDWMQALVSGGTIALYAAGVFAGAVASKPIRRAVQQAPGDAVQWPARMTAILGAEFLFVIAAAISTRVYDPARSSLFAHAVIGTCAFAVGLQSAAVSALKLPGVVTTFISGTWTTLVSGLAQLFDGEEEGPKERPWEKRLTLQSVVLVSYCLSAACEGLLMHYAGRSVMGWFPVAMLLLLLVAALRWRQS